MLKFTALGTHGCHHELFVHLRADSMDDAQKKLAAHGADECTLVEGHLQAVDGALPTVLH